jgi:hypothetical protein
MSDEEKTGRRGIFGAIEGLAGKVEDSVERLVKGDRDEHHAHGHCRHCGACLQPGAAHTCATPAGATGMTINVNVSCCPCPPDKPGGGGTGPGTTGRPTHQTGTSDGSLPGGAGNPGGGIIKIPTRPINVWPGPRTQLFLPLLFIRANAGDTGARPVVGAFWESPDIFVLPNVAPAAAPAVPAVLGGVAQAGADNTVYAHVWNLGQAPAFEVLVEFYWFNPTLGFSGADANLIGFTYTSLGARSGPGSHRVVKCPVSWKAQFLNGGHECLVVRISDAVSDPLSGPAWDASQNRHVGQRNIHVMSAAEAAAKPTIGINVGPLFAQPAQVAVTRADPATMPWLHLVTMDRTKGLGNAPPTGDVGITAPLPAGAPLPNLGAVPDPRGAGLIGNGGGVTGDGQQVGFIATDGDPGAGNAHVYRVHGTQNGQTFGGYTVVIVGS